MNQNEIRQANRKALPKFLFIMVICMVVGGAVGFCAAKYGMDALAGSINTAGAFFGIKVAPWLLLAAAVGVPMVCVPIYQSAKKLLPSWDGENEEISDRMDEKISVVIWITSAALILAEFLIAAAYSGGFSMFDDQKTVLTFFVSIASFLAIMVESIILQQKCVDAVKQTNPEKKASVYDMKFQKKWMDDCDEAEKIVVGKCAYKAYIATNLVCAILAMVLAICALVFGIGFLPSFSVCLIWIVNLSVYCKEAMGYSKAGNKIS